MVGFFTVLSNAWELLNLASGFDVVLHLLKRLSWVIALAGCMEHFRPIFSRLGILTLQPVHLTERWAYFSWTCEAQFKLILNQSWTIQEWLGSMFTQCRLSTMEDGFLFLAVGMCNMLSWSLWNLINSSALLRLGFCMKCFAPMMRIFSCMWHACYCLAIHCPMYIFMFLTLHLCIYIFVLLQFIQCGWSKLK